VLPYNANRFYIYNNRYRYRKNSIINKDVLPLVGIFDCSLLELILFIVGTTWIFYSLSLAHVWPLLPRLWQRYCLIAFSGIRPDRRHEFPMVIVFMHDWFGRVTLLVWGHHPAWYQTQLMRTHNFNLDILLIVRSVVGTSDVIYYDQRFIAI